MSLKIFSTPYELAEKFAEELIFMINKSAKRDRNFSIALSGGSTPEILFGLMGDRFSNAVMWDHVHLFWGDERCVPPDDPDSNYGMVNKKLIERIEIPSANIHRIRGEYDPENEAIRYSNEISDFTEKRDGLPLLDYIILGLGEDGHTASIFPGNEELFQSDKICEVAVHPVTLQKRITMTGRIINNADHVTFLITGKKKAHVVEKLIKKNRPDINFPASFVVPSYGVLRWYLDRDAGSLL
jgi:6-phosphogluconolactonase